MRASPALLACAALLLALPAAEGGGGLQATTLSWTLIEGGGLGASVFLPAQVHLFGQRAGATSRTVALVDVSGHAEHPLLDVRVEYADGSVEEDVVALPSGGVWVVRATLDHAKPVARVVVGYQDDARPRSHGALEHRSAPLEGHGGVYNEQAVYARGAQQTLAFAYLIEGPPGTRVLDHWSYRGLGGMRTSWWGVSEGNVARAAWVFTNPGVSLEGIDVRYAWTSSAEPPQALSARMQAGTLALPCAIRSGEQPAAASCAAIG